MSRRALVDQNGDVRCPKCHARQSFERRRRGRRMLANATLVGPLALFTGKTLSCMACGATITPGSPREWVDGSTSQTNQPRPVVADLGTNDGTFSVWLTGSTHSTSVIAARLLRLLPNMQLHQRQWAAERVHGGQPVRVAQLDEELAGRLAARMRELGLDAEVRS